MPEREQAPPPLSLPSFLGQCVQAGLVAQPGIYTPVLLEPALRPEWIFDSFFVTESSREAVTAARAAAGGQRPPGGCLVLQAGPGQGKSHLLAAILAERGEERTRYIDVADWDAELERARWFCARAELRQAIGACDLLLLDDLDACRRDADLQQEVLAVWKRMATRDAVLVATTSTALDDMEELAEQLHSRLAAGASHRLGPTGHEERLALLQAHPDARGLPEAVQVHLATYLGDDVRRMLSAARQIEAMTRETGEILSEELARAVVPLPTDLAAEARGQEAIDTGTPEAAERASRFKSMLATAETPEEQALALEIAFNERLRELRASGASPEQQRRFEAAVQHLRDGQIEEALRCVES
jgi:chromosomal replication initiation ATPase DnaA